MEFEYRLENWNGMAVLQITKMPEELREKHKIHECENGWERKSERFPQIVSNYNEIYIRGNEKDCDFCIATAKWSDEIPAALKEFQLWCERKYGPMSKFTHEQIETLRTLHQAVPDARYIAMDKDGKWNVFKTMPEINDNGGIWEFACAENNWFGLKDGLLPEIPWEESLFDLDERLGV